MQRGRAWGDWSTHTILFRILIITLMFYDLYDTIGFTIVMMMFG